jgi:hypothetical protein
MVTVLVGVVVVVVVVVSGMIFHFHFAKEETPRRRCGASSSRFLPASLRESGEVLFRTSLTA